VPELDGIQIPRREVLRRVGRLGQVAGVRLVTLGDGAERGVRVLEFRTGTGFAFDVVVDRGFDIGRCEHNGRSLAWISPTGVTGPWYAEPAGWGFFRNFGGGLLTTCGLDHAFAPAEDTAAQYHYPDKPTEQYGLHGRVSSRPARLVGYGEQWDGDDCTLYAEGEVVQAAVFGEQLLLRRRIEARLGESRLVVRDRVENIGYDPTPHMLLYHVNVGWPVLDDDSELLLPAPGFADLRGHRPVRGCVQQAFEPELQAERDGRVPVALVNRRRGLGAYQLFRQDQLPHYVVWWMLGEGTYVAGLEPSTNRLAGRKDARERGQLAELAPSESRAYELELGALVDGEIDAFADRVRDARRGTP
jgi:Domain of unknown function (DUF4432)